MTQFHAWEANNCEHSTDVNISEKTVVCKRKPVQGITLVIGMFFDGTGNNVFNTDTRLLGKCTNLDVGMSSADTESCLKKIEKSINGAGSYLGYYSNIHWLNRLYTIKDVVNESQNIYQRKVYVQGIGTAQDKEDSLIGMGLGAVFEGVVDKTDEGVSKISSEISKFLEDNASSNFAIEKIKFDVFGFSRGSAAARHFCNRIRRGDTKIVDAINQGLKGRNYHGKLAGEVRFLGLFDTVCAVGGITNLFNVHGSVNPGVELFLPKNVAENVFQISAMHEARYNFSLNSIKEAWPELKLPGVHSDIGGGYNPKEKEYLFLTQPKYETVEAEQEVKNTAIYNRVTYEMSSLSDITALKYIIPTGNVKVETWYDYLVNPNKSHSSIKFKRVGAAVTFERTVTNSWSNVTLRVMKDAAEEAGVLFNEITSTDIEVNLNDELIPLCEKALKQARSIRHGSIVEPFTHNELSIIGKYIHCSANFNPVKFKNVWLNGSDLRTIYGAVPVNKTFGFVNIPGDGWERAVWDMEGKKHEGVI